jgi:hypothetical protein
MQKHRRRVACTALLTVALGSLALAAGAQAKLTGNYTRFQQCPFTNSEVTKCIYAVTESGETVLGKKKVPIEKPVILQGGYGKAVEGFASFFAATNGETLTKVPQNVPGGLAGIVPEEGAPFLVKALIKFFFENKLTGLNATLELSKPANEIKLNEFNLLAEEGTALKLPVKVHLENPFLGKNCFIGSSTSPVIWNLTDGKTNPPLPNKSITGSGGTLEFLEEGRILETKGTKLVDNAWSAPGASGCGGIISFLVNPIINSQLGTTTAGNNTAILNNTVFVGSSFAVKTNNEENP